MNTIESCWEDILNKMKTDHNISPVSFGTWLQPLKICEVQEEAVTILVPFSWQREQLLYVNKKYKLLLQEIISEVTGISNCEVFFYLPGAELLTEQKSPKEKDNTILQYYTKCDETASLFIGDYNRDTFENVHKIISEIYDNSSANNLLTICADGKGYGLTAMLLALQNDLYKYENKQLIYMSAESFVEYVIEQIIHKQEVSQLFEPIIEEVHGIIIDDVDLVLRMPTAVKGMCIVAEQFAQHQKPVILATHVLDKKQFLDVSREHEEFSRIIVSANFVERGYPTKEDRMEWTSQNMEKYKIFSEETLAKYYIAQEDFRGVKKICELLGAHGREQHENDNLEYVDFTINDFFKLKYKL